MFRKCLEDVEVNLLEYAFLMSDHPVSSGSWWVRVPTLMPLIPEGYPYQTYVYYDNNIFLNDDACKPVTVNWQCIQNYMSVKAMPNRDFQYKANDEGIIPDGTRVIVAFMENNPRDPMLTDFF